MLTLLGFLGGSEVKNLPANSGDTDLIPGLGRYPGGGNGNPLQYSCLENSMDRGAWWATVHGSQRVGGDLADRPIEFKESFHSVKKRRISL